MNKLKIKSMPKVNVDKVISDTNIEINYFLAEHLSQGVDMTEKQVSDAQEVQRRHALLIEEAGL